MRILLAAAVLLLVLLLSRHGLAQPHAAIAQPPLHDSLEGPETSWRPIAADTRYRLDIHERRRGNAHTGIWSEYVHLHAEAGSYVLVKHDLTPAAIIAELKSAVWVRADRAGIQVLGRVVLPQTKDPRTARAASIVVHGSGYTRVGSWQQLELVDLPQLVERQLRVLRAQGVVVDARGAYLDQLLLNIYGGPGTTGVSIDDLHVEGIVSSEAPHANVSRNTNVGFHKPGLERLPLANAAVSNSQSAAPRIKLAGSLLTAGGRPLVPRAIEWNGEALSYLKGLGFNAVCIRQVPRAELLAEAMRLGLWIIATPPGVDQIAAKSSEHFQFGPEYDGVLAWDLGRGISRPELSAVENWAQVVRRADTLARPIIVNPIADLRSYSRVADVLCAGRTPIGSTIELAEYATWLKERTQLARPGTSFWATVQTELPTQVVEQWRAFRRMQTSSSVSQPSLDHEQIRQVTLAAVAAGMRGLVFQSTQSLEAALPAARRRSSALKMINLELQLIEPWIAAGNFVTTATASDPHVVPIVLQAERSRMVIPLVAMPRAQLVMGGTESVLSVVVPGVPEGNKAYLVSTTEIRPLAAKRAPGGTRVEIDANSRFGFVLLTGDDAVLRGIQQRIAAGKKDAIRLVRDLTLDALRRVQEIDQSLCALGGPPNWTTQLRAIGASISGSSGAFNSVESCSTAAAQLRSIQREQWVRALGSTDAPLANPLAANFEMLPELCRSNALLASGRFSSNRLSTGGFENLDLMVRGGWRHLEHPQDGVTAAVELSPALPRTGSHCLQLNVSPRVSEDASRLLETAALWVTSAPVDVAPGEVIRIEAYVRIPERITGSSDGLLMLDSLGGEPLAQRIGETHGWQKIVAFRVATDQSPLTVTFALSGFGRAFIDDLSVQVLTGPIR